MDSKIALAFLLVFLVALSGCPTSYYSESGVDKLPYDAIAVWMHQLDSGDWDIWYSVWNDAQKIWVIPGKETVPTHTEPVATLSGNDFDPDVSSHHARAMSVWAHEDAGSLDIYYSEWINLKWTKAQRLAGVRGDDFDPTVAVSPEGAMAVWVNETDGKRTLMYSRYTFAGKSWSAPKPVAAEPGYSSPSLPEVTFNERGLYGLVFIAQQGDRVLAFGSGSNASGEWNVPVPVKDQDVDAIGDTSNPTVQRTGIDSDKKGLSGAVWPTSKGVYAANWAAKSSPAKFVDEGDMPDIALDSESRAHALYTKGGSGSPPGIPIANYAALWHAADVFGALAAALAADTPEADMRNSTTFILQDTIGLMVWWTPSTKPSEIYFSRYDGRWSEPKPVDPNTLAGADLNPAVTPIAAYEEWVEEWEEYCGDGVLQFPEQCENGIACVNPTDTCVMPFCVCIPSQNYCGDGIVQAPNDQGQMEQCEDGVVACPNPMDACIWCDCYPKEYCYNPPGSDYVGGGGGGAAAPFCIDNCPPGLECDLKDCECKGKQRPCSQGREGSPPLKPGEVCKDDCPKDEICNVNSCICEPEKPKRKCSEQTASEEGRYTTTFNAAREICEDDCPEGMYCDPKGCACIPIKEPREYYCLGHTQERGYRAGVDACKDECPDGRTCDPESCTCLPRDETVRSCAADTLTPEQVRGGGTFVTTFDPAKQQCKNDCPEGYTCNSEYCVCLPESIDKEKVPCRSGETTTTERFNPATQVCDGTTCPTDQYCNTEGCYCEKKQVLPCGFGGGTILYESRYMTCNTSTCPEQYTCDPKICVCIADEVPPKEISCASGSALEGPGGFRSGIDICKNDCPQGYTCNTGSCTCTQTTVPPKTFTCSGSTQTSGYRPGTDVCQNNCDSGFTCDTQTCTCKCVDSDSDGKCDSNDNCKNTYNPKQEDEDGDGQGDYCDPTPFNCGSHYPAYVEIGSLAGAAQTMGQNPQSWCTGIAQFPEPQVCTTQCNYTRVLTQTYTVNGQVVNQFSCCWSATRSVPCSDCPGQNPVCPSGEQVCPGMNPFPPSGG